MSRINVFKLSGNMALGAQDNNYNNNDFENIKSSLKLLKSKQPQKRSEAPLEPTVCISLSQNLYGGSYSSNSNQRQQPNPKSNQRYIQNMSNKIMEITTTNPLVTSNPLTKMSIIKWSSTTPLITLPPRRNTLRITNSQLSKIETVTEIQDSSNHLSQPINSLHTKMMTMITECQREGVTTLTTKLSRKLTEIIVLKSLNMTLLS